MKRKNIKPIVISSLLAISFGATSIGTSFALFTDKAETTINVTSGIVDIDSSIAISEVKELYGVDVPKDTVTGVYTNTIGGTTELLNANSVKLTNWAPGDKATFVITNLNKSNVKIKTRFTSTHTSSTEANDLFDALTINYAAKDKNNADISGKIMSWEYVDAVSEANLATGEVFSTITVTVEFKDDGDTTIKERTSGENNSYQRKDCVITFLQEAVQGNAVTDTLLERINARLSAQATPNLSMSEAVKDLEGVANEAAIFTNNFVWNSATDRFVEEDDVEQNFYQYFKMYAEMPQTQDYSIYAYGTNWATTTAIDLNGIGFDVGSVSIKPTVSYVRDVQNDPHHVKINLNGGNLVFNAQYDSVDILGTYDDVNIIRSANQSAHLYGKANYVSITKGRLVLEKNAEPNLVYLNTKVEDYESSELTRSKTAFDDITLDVSKYDGKINLARNYVQIDTNNGTKVCTIKTANNESDIYLFQQGIYEQMKLQDKTEDQDSELEWVNNSKVDDTTKKLSDALANDYFGNANLNNSETRVIDPEDTNNVVQTGKDIETIKAQNSINSQTENEDEKIDVCEITVFKDDKLFEKLNDLGTLVNLPESENKVSSKVTVQDMEIIKVGDKSSVSSITFNTNFKFSDSQKDEEATFDRIFSFRHLEDEEMNDLSKSFYSKHSDWEADFSIRFNNDIEAGSVALIGAYGGMSFCFTNPVALKAKQEQRLLGYMRMSWSYANIRNIVSNFLCSITNIVDGEATNTGTTATVALKIYNSVTGESIVINETEYVF